MIGVSGRRAAAASVLVFVLSGCGLLSVGESPPGQPGSRGLATQGADAFLSALARHDADEAWSHLTPATRRVVYDDDEMVFAQDVGAADWSVVVWEFGPSPTSTSHGAFTSSSTRTRCPRSRLGRRRGKQHRGKPDLE